MAVTTQDSELLIQFRDPATKEKAYTSLIRKYQERLYWHIRRMVVEHEDANDVLPKRLYPRMEWTGKFPRRLPIIYLALSNRNKRMPDFSGTAKEKSHRLPK
jgi:hypothetical protein